MLKSVDNRVGIILDNLGPSQKSYYAISNANKLSSLGGFDITLFYENLSLPCVEPKVSLMAINEIWHYSGFLIATSIDTALMLSKLTTKAKKIFYVYDLEWIRGKNDFIYNIDAFNSKTKIVARSKEHAKIIENYGNNSVKGIVPNFDIWKIVLC